MGPHSEGTEPLEHSPAPLLADPKILACLGAWLAVISVAMATLWLRPAHEPAARAARDVHASQAP